MSRHRAIRQGPGPTPLFRWILVALTLLSFAPFSLSQGCTATKLCETGCCSQYGFCGSGPEFCSADNCVSSCDYTAGCDAKKLCATGCCSKFGFCGTGPGFCDDDNCVSTCDFKLDCDENTPCKEGCCSKFGFCGLGPDFCDPEVCVNNCDSKSYCNPGYAVTGYAEVEACPLNVCCSKFGFCGLTSEFCGEEADFSPSCDASPSDEVQRVVGYWEEWAGIRPCHAFTLDQYQPGVYTHINVAFATIDPVTFHVRPGGVDSSEFYLGIASLKAKDPGLKVYVALGGWSFNDPGETLTTFSDIANSVENQVKFIQSLVSFMATYDFDGVDIDWEYPGAPDRGGRTTDFAAYPQFMSNLKTALRSTGGREGLSMAIPASFWYLQHFDIASLSKHVDWFNVMTYDLHGSWDEKNKFVGPYLNAHTNLTEIKDALDLLWRNNINPSKVTMGLAFYGRTYTVDPGCVTPGCVYKSAGKAGPCSGEAGILANSEILDIISEKGLTPTLYKEAAVKVVHWDDQWVSYDDQDTFQLKINFAKENCLGGVMVWAMSHDSADGRSAFALGKAASRSIVASMPGNFFEVQSPSVPTDKSTTADGYVVVLDRQCHWTGCGEVCQSSFEAPVVRNGPGDDFEPGVSLMMDNNACPDTKQSRTFCCPTNYEPPICGWWEHGGNGKCETHECPAGYAEVGSTGIACKHDRHQVACCNVTAPYNNVTNVHPALVLYEETTWGGSGWEGDCEASCDTDKYSLVDSGSGSGGVYCKTYDQADNNGKMGVLVEERPYCYSPKKSVHSGWGSCAWHKNLGTAPPSGIDPDGFCLSDCPAGHIRAALETAKALNGGKLAPFCTQGASAFCCTDDMTGHIEVVEVNSTAFEDAMAVYTDGDCSDGIKERSLLISPTGLCSTSTRATLKVWIRYFFSIGWSIKDRIAEDVEQLKLWESYVLDKFPLLTLENLGSYALCFAPSEYDQMTEDLIQNPLRVQSRVTNDTAAIASTGTCVWVEDTTESCEDEEDCEDEAEDEPEIQLVKRGALSEFKWAVMATRGLYRGLSPSIAVTLFQRLPYPSSGQVYTNRLSIPASERVFRLFNHADIGSPRVQMLPFTEALEGIGTQPARLPAEFNTEHIFETQTFQMFLRDRQEGLLPATTLTQPIAERIDSSHEAWSADYIQTHLMSPVLDDRHGTSDRTRTPFYRMLDSTGTRDNDYPFVVLQRHINNYKALMWARKRLIPKESDWKSMYTDTTNPCPAVGLIRGNMAVFEYLRHPQVSSRFSQAVRDIQIELSLAQGLHDRLEGGGGERAIDFVGAFNEWMEHFIASVEAHASSQVGTMLTNMDGVWDVLAEAQPESPAVIQTVGQLTALRAALPNMRLHRVGLNLWEQFSPLPTYD